MREDQRGSSWEPGCSPPPKPIWSRGCDRVALSAHYYQAPDFYARFGYAECGRTPGYPNGRDEIHLLKHLGSGRNPEYR